MSAESVPILPNTDKWVGRARSRAVTGRAPVYRGVVERSRRLRRVALGAGAAGAAAGAVVVGALVVREARRSGWRVLLARARRGRRVAWLATRRTAARARLGRPGRSTDEALDDFHVHTAAQASELLGDMKGVAMKLGQMASLLADGLPAAYTEALQSLQQGAPPMSSHLVGEVVEAELGEPPERAFFEFSPEPVAAASIGQVHRAVLFDGRVVAVKVQDPGIDTAIRADLDNAYLLTTMAKTIAPGIEPGPLVDEIRARILDELNYRKEAANQEEFRAAFRDHPWVRIPAVVPELSARRVLVSDWATGASLYDVLDRSDADRDQIGEQLFRFWCDAVFRLGFFNGDPHPGNYFFDVGARPNAGGPVPIWFLDFGLVKRFAPRDIEALREQILALRTGDRDRLRSVMVRYGWLRADAPVAFDRVAELAALANRPVVEHAPFTFTRQFLVDVVQSTLLVTGPYGDVVRQLTLPADQVILNRIHLGLYALLSRLGATADWASIMDEYLLDSAPTTPLGVQGSGWPRLPVARRPALSHS